MKPSEYAEHDAVGLAALIESKQVTPAEVVEAALGLIDALNPELNAVIHRHDDRAREEAAGALPTGPFRGVPFLLKDLGGGNRAGDPHHWGSTFLKDAGYRAPNSSYLVEKFIAAGLVDVGRTNVPELGAWSVTESQAYGPCRNPWNTDHSSGGSSGGAAAAVASRIVPVAHASDGGGSIRNPASQCGIVGLKPSRARVSLGPDVGESWAGMVFEFAVARSIRDVAAMLDAVHGPMPGDPYGIAAPARPYTEELGADAGALRVGVLAHHEDIEVHPDCVDAVKSAGKLLESLGHHVEAAWPAEVANSALLPHSLSIISSYQAKAVDDFGAVLGRELGPDDLDASNWAVTEIGRQVGGRQLLAALQGNQDYQRAVAGWWQGGFDLLVTPTVAVPPPLVGEMTPDPANPMDAFMRSGRLLPFLIPFNVTGQPSISLPLHWNEAGLPIGVQIVAAMGREDLLLRVAHQLEAEVAWPDRRPPVCAGA